MRILRHLFDSGAVRRRFPSRVLDAIQQAIAATERHHAGQIVFAVEGVMPLRELVRRCTARARAHAVFGHLRVWDTHHNTGVLIYVLLAERAIEIVADRGIAAKVDAPEWESICIRMQQRFAAGQFEQGAVEGVNAVGDVLARHFPADGSAKTNELPDRPIVL